MPTVTVPPMLTVSEVAARLSISEKTVKRLIASGDIAAIKAGVAVNSGYRVPETALAEFIRQRTVTAAS